MKKQLTIATLALLLGLFAQTAQAQNKNWAVGFRLGEPSGLNVRKYFGVANAFDLNVGTYGGLYGNVRRYRGGRYANVGLTIQGHYLWHGDIKAVNNLRYHYGFGGQINSRRYYLSRVTARGDYDASLSLGGSGVAGLEYFVPEKPFSFFLETGLYVEVAPAPLFMNVQSGIGLRFNL